MVPFLWYVICIKRVTGSWSISGKSGLTSMGVDASMKLLPSGLTYGESMAGKAGIANLFPSMLGFLKIYVTQLGKFAMVAYSSLPGIVFIVAAVGLALLVYELCRREPAARLKSVCQFAMFLSPLIMLVPVMAFDKIALATSYILPFFIVLLGCSAKGIVWMEGLLARQVERLISTPTVMKQGLSVAVIAAVILSWHSLAPLYKGLSSEDFKDFSGQQDFLLRQTGHWFLNYTDKTAKIMARWSNIGYYGERRWHGLADGSIDDLIVYARRSGVTHIVIDSDAVPRRRPQLKDLLEPSIPHPGLVPVYAEDRFGTRVVIYLVQ